MLCCGRHLLKNLSAGTQGIDQLCSHQLGLTVDDSARQGILEKPRMHL